MGVFRTLSTPGVRVISVKPLYSSYTLNRQKTYTKTKSKRVTFERTVLPSFLVYEGLRIPIARPFVPKIPTCEKCSEIGHTKDFCSNKFKCFKCQGHFRHFQHSSSDYTAAPFKCAQCKKHWQELKECPVHKNSQNELKMPSTNGVKCCSSSEW